MTFISRRDLLKRAAIVGGDQPRDDRVEDVGLGRGQVLERLALREGFSRMSM